MHTHRPRPGLRRIVTSAAAIAVTVMIVDTVTFAATGSSLVLGRLNTAGTTTVIQNTGTGPALKLLTKTSSQPALSTNAKGKVKNLYAERAATANVATNAGHATNADTATNAGHATNADTATNADHATNADTATNAGHATAADTATNADRLGGKTLAEVQASVGQRPAHILWVAPTGGDYTSLSAALASISDNSVNNPYLVRVAPGTYTEVAGVAMKDYVDVEGSGREVTTITCACGTATAFPLSVIGTITVTGSVHGALRNIRIVNTGGSTFTNGVVLSSVPGTFRFDHVSIAASGAVLTAFAIEYGNSSGVLADSDVTATGTGSFTIGVDIYADTGLVTDHVVQLDSVRTSASGGTSKGVSANFATVRIIASDIGPTIYSQLSAVISAIATEVHAAVVGTTFHCSSVVNVATFAVLSAACL